MGLGPGREMELLVVEGDDNGVASKLRRAAAAAGESVVDDVGVFAPVVVGVPCELLGRGFSISWTLRARAEVGVAVPEMPPGRGELPPALLALEEEGVDSGGVSSVGGNCKKICTGMEWSCGGLEGSFSTNGFGPSWPM